MLSIGVCVCVGGGNTFLHVKKYLYFSVAHMQQHETPTNNVSRHSTDQIFKLAIMIGISKVKLLL